MAYNDKKQDAKTMKGMKPAQKAAFKKADIKMDKALAAKIKKLDDDCELYLLHIIQQRIYF